MHDVEMVMRPTDFIAALADRNPRIAVGGGDGSTGRRRETTVSEQSMAALRLAYAWMDAPPNSVPSKLSKACALGLTPDDRSRSRQ